MKFRNNLNGGAYIVKEGLHVPADKQMTLSHDEYLNKKKEDDITHKNFMDEILKSLFPYNTKVIDKIKKKIESYKKQLDYLLIKDASLIQADIQKIKDIDKKLWYVHALDSNLTFMELLKNIETIQAYILLKAISKVCNKTKSDPSTTAPEIKNELTGAITKKIKSVTELLNLINKKDDKKDDGGGF